MLAFAHVQHNTYHTVIECPKGLHRATLAMELPTRKNLESLYNIHASHILVNVGVANCSEKDHYVKAKGRQLATDRMKTVPVQLSHIEIKGIKHIYHFELIVPYKNTIQTILFGLATIAEAETSRIVYSHFGINKEEVKRKPIDETIPF